MSSFDDVMSGINTAVQVGTAVVQTGSDIYNAANSPASQPAAVQTTPVMQPVPPPMWHLPSSATMRLVGAQQSTSVQKLPFLSLPIGVASVGAPPPQMQARDFQASTAVSGSSETGILIVLGVIGAAAALFIGRKTMRTHRAAA